MTNRGRRWCITINNPTEEDLSYAKSPGDLTKTNRLLFAIFQLEKGEKETEHLQGYCEYSNQTSIYRLKKVFPRGHFEKARGTKKQNIDYCSKEETKIAGPWIFGNTNGGQGYRQDLVKFKDLIKNGESKMEIVEQCPVESIKYHKFIDWYKGVLIDEEMKKRPSRKWVCCIWGETGTGKTRHVYDKYKDDLSKLFVFSSGTGSSIWFDGYEGQEAVLFDDFYGNFMSLGTLLQITDRYRFSVQRKGTSSVVFNPKKIYFTSNVHPIDWYKVPTCRKKALLRRFTGGIIKKQRGVPFEECELTDEEEDQIGLETQIGTPIVSDDEEESENVFFTRPSTPQDGFIYYPFSQDSFN